MRNTTSVTVDSADSAALFARRLAQIGVPAEASGNELILYEAHLPVLERVTRDEGPPVRAEARGGVCPACSGPVIDGVCTSCYWSEGSRTDPPDIAARRLDQQLLQGVVVDRCIVLGGSNVPLLAGASVVLLFDVRGASILDETGTHTLLELEWDTLRSLWIGGAGEVTSDAGIIGGGQGLQGAATGMLLAWVINRITRETTVSTILGLTLRDGELILCHGRFGPQTLRLILSPVITRVGSTDSGLPTSDGYYEPRGSGVIFWSPT